MCAKKKSAKKSFMIVLSIVLALVLAIMLAGTYYASTFLNRINRVEDVPQETLTHEEVELILAETDPVEEEFTGETLNPEDVTLPEEPVEVIEKKDEVVNILLIGQDRRPGQGRQRSDAMILCTINKDQKTLTMTSFLRDTYVMLPEYNGQKYGGNRLNVPYAVGGMEMLDQCLLDNFGVVVDHNIEVDFSGFEKIVNALGGVDIELTATEAAWIGGVGSGMNRLNGEKALEYSRIRKLDSDFGRANRQRKVLMAMMERARNLSLNELRELTDTIFPMLTTDMSNGDIIKYVMDFFPLLMDLQITTQSVPQDGEYYFGHVNGMSVLIPDMEKINTRLRDTIGS